MGGLGPSQREGPRVPQPKGGGGAFPSPGGGGPKTCFPSGGNLTPSGGPKFSFSSPKAEGLRGFPQGTTRGPKKGAVSPGVFVPPPGRGPPPNLKGARGAPRAARKPPLGRKGPTQGVAPKKGRKVFPQTHPGGQGGCVKFFLHKKHTPPGGPFGFAPTKFSQQGRMGALREACVSPLSSFFPPKGGVFCARAGFGAEYSFVRPAVFGPKFPLWAKVVCPSPGGEGPRFFTPFVPFGCVCKGTSVARVHTAGNSGEGNPPQVGPSRCCGPLLGGFAQKICPTKEGGFFFPALVSGSFPQGGDTTLLRQKAGEKTLCGAGNTF